MSNYQYTIPTAIKFEYENAEGYHTCYAIATWTSPVTGKENITKVNYFMMVESQELEFYKVSQMYFTDTSFLKRDVSSAMAGELMKELEAGGGINFLEIERKKFLENLKLEFNLDLYIDLDRAGQTGDK